MFSRLLCAAALLAAASANLVKRDDAYGAPEAPSYGPPEPSYGPPEPAYEAPAETYGAPEPSYSAPSYTAPEAGGLDLTTLLIPILALVGLFLLFPTYVNLTSVRRKREADDISESDSIINRIQDMYQAVIESEECMERVACQVGGMARDAGIDNSIVSGFQLIAPTKYRKYIKRFSNPSNCHKIKCGSLF